MCSVYRKLSTVLLKRQSIPGSISCTFIHIAEVSPSTRFTTVSGVNFLHGLDSTFAIDEVSDTVPRKPCTLRHHEVGDQGQNGDSGHDDGGICSASQRYEKLEVIKKKKKKKMLKRTIQVLSGDWPLVGGEQNSDNPAIPEDTDELERLTPATETPLWLREPVRSA